MHQHVSADALRLNQARCTTHEPVWLDWPMDLHRSPTVDDFLAHAGSFLAAREAAHNLLFGITANLAADPTISDGPPYLATVSRGGTVVAAALRTPPWNLVLSEVDDLAALDDIVEDLAVDPQAAPLTGVAGPAGVAEAFADRWSARTGFPNRRGIAERIFSLTTVRPPRPAPGHLRIAGPADRDLLIAWYQAFHDEALGPDSPLGDPAATVDRWLGGQRTSYLWEDGRTVSWCGVSGPTPNGIRIGPVYTPPGSRNRGYASSLVAAASQAQLDAGRRFCFLFTDLANPTSNHIYQEIGFEPVRDVNIVRFG
jgi:predicted GNAT family acetyltransferase